jgi:hypothetical protein
LAIQPQDVLARELFSNHLKPSGKLELNAFLVSERNDYGISLNRWCKVPRRLYESLALQRRRGPLKFKGFALFRATDLELVSTLDSDHLRAYGEPVRENPFHANVPVQRSREKSYYMQIASEMINKVKPKIEPLRTTE